MAIVESGLIEIWIEKHMKTMDTFCDRRLSSTSEKPMDLSDMTGAISVLLAGLVCAFVILLTEIIFRKLRLIIENVVYKSFRSHKLHVQNL